MKNCKKNCLKFLASSFILGFVIVGMSGCGAASLTPMQQEKLLGFNTADIQANVDNVKKAKLVDNLDFYSYKKFSEAEALAYQALSMNSDGTERIEVYNKVQESKKYLLEAYNSKQIIEKELSNILAYKKKLDELHAKELFNDEYSEISDNLTKMMQDIDDREGIKAFEPRDETLLMIQALYSKIRVSSNLHNVQAIMNSIDSSVAQKSYQKAQAQLKNAEFTINKYPDDEKMIEEVSNEALAEALYAQAVAKEVTKLSSSEENMELYVLNEHEKLVEIYKSIDANVSTFRTLSYSSKVASLRDVVAKRTNTLKSLTAENSALKISLEENQKNITQLNQKVDAQLLDNKLLQSKIETLNSDLLKTKDGTLDVNAKLLQAQNDMSLLEKSLQEMKN